MKIPSIYSVFISFWFGNPKTSNTIHKTLLGLCWCQIGPKSQIGTRKGFNFGEIMESAEKFELTSNMLAAWEIDISDLCCWFFWPLQVLTHWLTVDLVMKFKLDSNAFSSGQENQETLCLCDSKRERAIFFVNLNNHSRQPKTFSVTSANLNKGSDPSVSFRNQSP
jgi:hypothetical protein